MGRIPSEMPVGAAGFGHHPTDSASGITSTLLPCFSDAVIKDSDPSNLKKAGRSISSYTLTSIPSSEVDAGS